MSNNVELVYDLLRQYHKELPNPSDLSHTSGRRKRCSSVVTRCPNRAQLRKHRQEDIVKRVVVLFLEWGNVTRLLLPMSNNDAPAHAPEIAEAVRQTEPLHIRTGSSAITRHR